MEPTAAGVIVTDGKSILLCHVTDSKHWDLPKGKIDPGELDKDAAIRELYEETGIEVTPDQVSEIGIFSYKKGKILSLWLYKVERMPDISTLFCHSTFDNGKGMMKLEMDGYQAVQWNQIEKFVVLNMYKVLVQVKKIIKKD